MRLVLFHELRLKGPRMVAWCIQLKATSGTFYCFSGRAIFAIWLRFVRQAQPAWLLPSAA